MQSSVDNEPNNKPPSKWRVGRLLAASVSLLLIGMIAACSLGPPKIIIDDPSIERHITTVSDSGIKLGYLQSGQPGSTRVIFVHGTPGDASNWYTWLKNVPRDREYFAVDRPGFGTTEPRGAYTALDTQAAALLPLLKAEHSGPTLLVGHSLGGPIIAAAAAKYPELIDGIIIAAGALDPGQEDVWFLQHLGNTWLLSWMLPNELDHANKELIGLEDELDILAPKLAGIQMPITIVHGTNDELVPYANVAYMQEHFKAAAPLSLMKVEGGDHFLPWNGIEIINHAIDQMIVELDQEPATPK